jgi:2-succinyl-6-hydroxy-2,4-cyclohexadiene-1-carboxylate synthase
VTDGGAPGPEGIGQVGVGQLNVERIGEGTSVGLLHGFTQNAAAWGRFEEILSASHRVDAVDLPGHRGSSDLRANLWQTAELVCRSCGPCDYIGYSLGGRVLLHAALCRPDAVQRVVLIGATAGIEDDSERADRVASDELLASELDATEGNERKLEEFLTRWIGGPLFAGLSEDAACMSARMENTGPGLASSLRLCGTGRQEPLWERLGELTMPVLVLAGERDQRFRLLGRRLADAIGDNATFAVVAGSNHACQLERPVETADMIEEFLTRSR